MRLTGAGHFIANDVKDNLQQASKELAEVYSIIAQTKGLGLETWQDKLYDYADHYRRAAELVECFRESNS